MKIAQIAPPEGAALGGTERVVSYLAEELMRLGHDVTVFAGGDSVLLERVRRHAHEFDVLHSHLEAVHFPIFRELARKTVTTVHGRLDLPGRPALYREFGEMPLVSVSDRQRRFLPSARWLGTVYPGLAAEVCPLNPSPPRGPGRYFACLARVSPEEGLQRALAVARVSGVRLRVEPAGELDNAAKPGFLGNAAALLCPAGGPEPFALAMIEAMSCGTPVIAWPDGSAPEIVDHGVTGFIVDSIEAAAAAAREALRLDREKVRERFEERFSAARMARDYLACYRALGRSRTPSAGLAALRRL